jgi:hypothetical protein
LSEFSGGQIAQRAVWSVIVVVLSPCFNLLPGTFKRQKSVFVQTLGATSAVERLDESVIREFARPAEVEHHLIGVSLLISMKEYFLRPGSGFRIRKGSCSPNPGQENHDDVVPWH